MIKASRDLQQTDVLTVTQYHQEHLSAAIYKKKKQAGHYTGLYRGGFQLVITEEIRSEQGTETWQGLGHQNKRVTKVNRKSESTVRVNALPPRFLLIFTGKKETSSNTAGLGENKALILLAALSTAEDSDQ